MSFLFPIFLFAFISLLIPIILHLYNFTKHKKIVFSHSFFLEKLKIQSEKPSRLQKKILLIARLLLLAALILAFAQPLFNKDKSNNNHRTSIIYLDQNPSMAIVKDGKSLWEHAKSDVLLHLNQLQEDEKVAILSSADNKVYQSVFKEEAIRQVKAMELENRYLPFSDLLQNIENLEKELNQSNNPIFIYSNFQKTLWEKELNELDVVNKNSFNFINYTLENYDNYWIDTAYISSEEDKKMLNFKLAAQKEEKEYVKVQFLINNKLNQSVQVEKVNSYEGSIELNNLAENSHLQLIIQDDAISFDDTLFMVYRNSSKIPIAYLNTQNTNAYLKVLEDALPNAYIENLSLHSGIKWKEFPFIIYESHEFESMEIQKELLSYVENGGKLMWFPNYNQSADNIKQLLGYWSSLEVRKKEEESLEISRMEIQHPIVKEIFDLSKSQKYFPSVNTYFSYEFENNLNKRSLFQLKNGDEFLSEIRIKKGSVFISSVALDPRSSDFVQSYLFAPLIYAIASKDNLEWPLYFVNTNKNEWLIPEVGNTKEPWHIVSENTDRIPKQEEWLNGKKIILEPFDLQKSWYELKKEKNEKASYFIAYNLSSDFSKLESLQEKDWSLLKDLGIDYQFLESSKIKNADFISSQSKNIKIWQYLVFLGIIFLIFDTLWIYRDNT